MAKSFKVLLRKTAELRGKDHVTWGHIWPPLGNSSVKSFNTINHFLLINKDRKKVWIALEKQNKIFNVLRTKEPNITKICIQLIPDISVIYPLHFK